MNSRAKYLVIIFTVLSCFFLIVWEFSSKSIICYYTVVRNGKENLEEKLSVVSNFYRDSIRVLENQEDNDSIEYSLYYSEDSVWLLQSGWLIKNDSVLQWQNNDLIRNNIRVLQKYDTVINGMELSNCYKYLIHFFYSEEMIVDSNQYCILDYSFGKHVIIRYQRFYGRLNKYDQKLDSLSIRRDVGI